MDFFNVSEREGRKKGSIDIYPEFKVSRSKDLMVRGRGFYAIWDASKGLWSTDEYDVVRLVDEELWAARPEIVGRYPEDTSVAIKLMSDFSSGSWMAFRNFLGHISDSSAQLDDSLTFSNTVVKQGDYVSRRLPYPLEAGDHSAWDEMISVLYSPEDRAKIEWAIGCIVAGDSKNIQKFLVFYGGPGTGKSTVLNIIAAMFVGYVAAFEAKALTSSNSAFSMEMFASNPLVAIQHDGDLSKIEDNTKLNSIISHEEMRMNEKYKPGYDVRINAFLLMGTNKPVKISDAKSGIIRRLIDVHPTGEKIPAKHYTALLSRIQFELGAIAQHCLDVYRTMGKHYYDSYRATEMMLQTDVFYNFIEANYETFEAQDGTTIASAFAMYKAFCEDTLVEFKMPMHRFREELAQYFDNFDQRAEINGARVRSWYSGFKADKFKTQVVVTEHAYRLVIEDTESLLDSVLEDCPAQYATADEVPVKKWINVDTTLAAIDTSKLHYVKVPVEHIVIDFDLRGDNGQKSIEKNLEAASQWPPTYAELSKGGEGVHLHYLWRGGDPELLARVFEEGIEVKVYVGDSSLRRRVSRCNNVPVAELSSGLALRPPKMINDEKIKSEKGLRDLIARILNKEIHNSTKPSVDFIKKVLEDAHDSDMVYDVTDMRQQIFVFAANSSNQRLECIKMVQDMKFASEPVEIPDTFLRVPKDQRLVFFDVEVFPNLFVVCWKYQGAKQVTRMINPSAAEVEELMGMKLVGFNCRRYDNHILYGRYMGFDNYQLYKLSKKIIEGVPNSAFREGYDISYADIFDFSSKRQSLKKFEIDLGLKHLESPLPWDEPVPPEKIPQVVAYCVNDVVATEATFEDREQDFIARQILADVSGLSVNATTLNHTSRIIFGDNRNPQDAFVYTNLAEQFPGYEYSFGKSTYKDEVTGEGGYVYAEPGMYQNVALLDVASMHPTSIEQLNLFGDYTEKFSELKEARMAIKRRDYDRAKGMLGGKLAQHLKSQDGAEALSYALKIVINTVYGLTSASFDNAFRDPRNIDNIVAKRGALFMIELKHYVQSLGFQVVHIKTDSVKIPEATPDVIAKVTEFGKSYGYDFEHEATYSKFCLVNDAVYAAKSEKGWTTVGTQFIHPYVFKTLFTDDLPTFEDMCETKQVTTALYLKFEDKDPEFVGKIGRFVPMAKGGAALLRIDKEGAKYGAATGTKGFLWLEATTVVELGLQGDVDYSYYERLVDNAREELAKHGDVEWFIS